jgi:putative MATE family efflux protein
MIALGNGLMVGISSLVARAIGEKNQRVLDRTAESGLFIALLLSLFSLGIILCFGPRLVGRMGAVDDYYTHGWDYLRYIVWVAPFAFLGNVFIGILQGEGQMRKVMNAMILGTMINIILDPVFIFLMHLEVIGAALATVVGQTASFLYVLTVFLKQQSSIRIHWKIGNIKRKIMANIISIGLPQSMAMILMAVSFIFFNRLVISIDPLALTAFSLFGRFEQLVLMPSFALSAAVVTIVGQNAARGLYDRSWKVMKKAYLSGSIVIIVLAAAMVIAAPAIYPRFSSIDRVVDYAVRQTWTQEFFYLFALLGITNRSFFQAVGHPLPALFLTLLRTILLSLPLAYLYVKGFGMGVEGVWWGLNTGSVISALFVRTPWVRPIVYRLKKGTFKVQSTRAE